MFRLKNFIFYNKKNQKIVFSYLSKNILLQLYLYISQIYKSGDESLFLNSSTCSRIHLFLQFHNFKNYLEIGVADGSTIKRVLLSSKTGVDPSPNFLVKDLDFNMYVMKSKEFFKENTSNFDFIYIDGDHQYETFIHDLVDSLKVLDEKGVILVDDVLPSDEVSSFGSFKKSMSESRNRNLDFPRPWMGTVFNIIFLLQNYKNEIDFYTLHDKNHVQLIIWIKKKFDYDLLLSEKANYTYEDLLKSDLNSLYRFRTDVEVVNHFKEFLNHN